MHKIAIYIPENAVPLDFVIPLEIFSRARNAKGLPLYEVSLCSLHKKTSTHSFQMVGMKDISILNKANTIIVPASEPPMPPLPQKVHRALKKAYQRKARIVSICGGAFYLAEAGLLDGKSATTHWFGTQALKEKFPKINVNPDVLYVDAGQVLTSAGACAGIDLCLHMIRKDFGALVAAQSAKYLVMPLERSGGQAQFIDHQLPTSNEGSLETLLGWIEKNLKNDLSIQMLCQKVNMSVRTFNRQFKLQTGTTPLKWILQARIRKARLLLESSRQPLEEIAVACGFGSPITMREHFKNIVSTSPSSYRETFQRNQ